MTEFTQSDITLVFFMGVMFGLCIAGMFWILFEVRRRVSRRIGNLKS